MLLDLEQVSSFVKAQEDLIKSLKLALVSHDPKRLPDMFPAFAPPPDNTKAIQALDSGAPVEIRTDVPAAEAQDILRRMASGEFVVEEIDDFVSVGTHEEFDY